MSGEDSMRLWSIGGMDMAKENVFRYHQFEGAKLKSNDLRRDEFGDN